MENLYIIGYGLSGGFGGIQEYEVIETTSLEDAEIWAWESACENYENYSGMYGLRDITDIMDEDGVEDEDEATEIYAEERENWLEYTAVKYSKEEEEKVSGNHFHNPYADKINK